MPTHGSRGVQFPAHIQAAANGDVALLKLLLGDEAEKRLLLQTRTYDLGDRRRPPGCITVLKMLNGATTACHTKVVDVSAAL